MIMCFLCYCSDCTIFRFSLGLGPVMVLFYIVFLHVLACSFFIQACSFFLTMMYKQKQQPLSELLLIGMMVGVYYLFSLLVK